MSLTRVDEREKRVAGYSTVTRAQKNDVRMFFARADRQDNSSRVSFAYHFDRSFRQWQINDPICSPYSLTSDILQKWHQIM
jgi:hypothetical protein